jgi:hypothetical protein
VGDQWSPTFTLRLHKRFGSFDIQTDERVSATCQSVMNVGGVLAYVARRV